eukprot:1314563-Pyramimonas_sp.AAC.1
MQYPDSRPTGGTEGPTAGPAHHNDVRMQGCHQPAACGAHGHWQGPRGPERGGGWQAGRPCG